MELSASLEDYIETIYHIVEEKQVARAKNIAKSMNVSRASVTEALRTLSSKGLINRSKVTSCFGISRSRLPS